jgi:hypothetical protein
VGTTKVSLKYGIVVIFSVLFTWVLHEFVHWFIAECLGYDAVMRLNGTSVSSSQNASEWHGALISISAPIITVIQGFVFFFILKVKGWKPFYYPFLFTAFYMRFLAGLMNVVNVNDEGRVGQFLGIGTYTLSILVSASLVFLIYRISKKYGLNWKFQLATVLTVMVSSSLLILADQVFKIRIL